MFNKELTWDVNNAQDKEELANLVLYGEITTKRIVIAGNRGLRVQIK